MIIIKKKSLLYLCDVIFTSEINILLPKSDYRTTMFIYFSIYYYSTENRNVYIYRCFPYVVNLALQYIDVLYFFLVSWRFAFTNIIRVSTYSIVNTH